MRKILFLSFLLASTAGVKAQSLKGTSWKVYIDEIHDTLTWHIGVDTCFTTDGNGETVVRALCKISKDTIAMKDIEGKYACTDGTGVYTYLFQADGLTLTMVNDPCDNRSNAINGLKWIRAK
ncbi:MAG TPA: hypothetical protein VHC48_02510 [Puia sp.]|nr:hypothetical protein [Puia sp.]